MLALDRTHTFPTAPELLFRMIKRRRVALHPDLDIRINVSRDRPEPAQLLGCLSILAHAPDLTAIFSHYIIKAVSVDRGDAGLTEDEGHAPIVPASTSRWLHLLASYLYMSLPGRTGRIPSQVALPHAKVVNSLAPRINA